MQITIKLFGITKDIFNAGEYNFQHSAESLSTGELHQQLIEDFPGLARLKSLRIAVNQAYADEHTIITAGSEVALIPPVSGG